MKHIYKTKNICPSSIVITYEKNIITDVEFQNGGCQGNLNALKKFIIGSSLEETVKNFKGNICGLRGTSCMDQLATACQEILDNGLIKM